MENTYKPTKKLVFDTISPFESILVYAEEEEGEEVGGRRRRRRREEEEEEGDEEEEEEGPGARATLGSVGCRTGHSRVSWLPHGSL